MARQVHYRTCNVCEAMCGMAITVDDGKIVDVRGDDQDVFSRGHICPKGPAMREIQEDPDRLRHPLRRTAAGRFERISWKEAYDETASRLREIQARHGRDAVGVYLGNPTVHNHGTVTMALAFVRALRTRNRFDANSLDANPKLFACLMMYGDPTAIPVPDVDRTDYVLMMGANPAASNGSLMSLGDVRGRMRGIRERGGTLVLLDPRRTETADWASEHHFIRPGADAAFLLAFLHVLHAEALVDRDAIARLADGADALASLVARFPPERVAAAVGIPADTIRRLARDFAKARRAVCYGRVGTCVNTFGSVASWLQEAVNVVTGNFDREGGAMFTTPAVDLGLVTRSVGLNKWGRWKSRVRGLPEFGGQLPAAIMAEEMETAGEGQIRAFVTLAGNPALSSPNAARLDAALARLEFMVSVDLYVNETTRHAHIILPPRYSLEHGHFDVVLQALAVRNVARWSETVIEPPPDTKDDWEILYELGMRLGGLRFGNAVLDTAARLAWRAGLRLTPDRIIDLLLRLGPHRLSLAKLKAAPHGIDLGPLVPAAAKRVRTAKKRVQLVPGPLVDDVGRVDRWLEEHGAANGGLLLIGRRHLRSNNSWMHNAPSLVKGPDRAALLMSPHDATRLGLAEGGSVRVKSRAGEVTARLSITETMMPGVVSLPHGFGHASAADTMRVAGALAGPNVNALTDEAVVEPLTGTAVLNGVPVVVAGA
jgi:anaerobic selenocysteine-containing dehydrogenase